MGPHSITLAWKIPWTEEPGRLQSMESLGVGNDWATSLSLFTFFFFLLYNIVLVLPHINMNPPWVYTCSHPELHPPPPSPYHPSRSSQCTSLKHPILKLDWRFISYMILYMIQCHSPKSSHPLPFPQSPKDCSIHLCLFFCLAYRVIIAIFLNSIYMS